MELSFFQYATQIPLFSRISPNKNQISLFAFCILVASGTEGMFEAIVYYWKLFVTIQ